MNIKHLINYSFNDATKSMVMGTSPSALARARQRAYMKTLVSHLEDELGTDDTRIFSEYQRGNSDDFGTEHLLYDIQVCKIATTKTADRKKEELPYIQSALWQIETDFSQEIPPAIYAFNRLVTGNAENKLFIGAQLSAGRDTFINTLKAPAAACNGDVYLALIPHPAQWDEDDHETTVWHFVDGDWQEA